jgi:hypothetical protein
MSDDVIKIIDHKEQYSPEDAVANFLTQMAKGEVERVLIIYKDSNEPNVCFVQGSVLGNYTVADVNWDIDQFKRLHLAGEFEPQEE